MKLDGKTVAALDLGGKTDAIFFDDDLPGFGYRLRLSAGGKVRKSWIVQYRRAGISRRLLLGAGEVLSAEQARQAARKALAKVALGEDPQADRRERRAKDRVDLKSMMDEYLLAKQTHVRARTFVEMRRYLTGGYFKPLHTMPIDAVTRKDVAAQLVRITREHSSISAARARTALSAFYVWAMQMGLTESNPIIGTLKPQDTRPRERVLNDQELAAIWSACRSDDHGRIIRLLILLGSRRAEIGGIAWSELDLEGAVWTLPAQRSKNGRAHSLPLMPMALSIIREVPRVLGRDLLFGERAARGFTAFALGKRDLDARSGVRDWVVHDIRRSVATGMANLGVGPHIVEEVLNHRSGHKGGIAGIYNRSRYEREVRAALGMWCDHIRTLVDGSERKVLAYRPAVTAPLVDAPDTF
ncbi:MAG: tyrosine-type recombinase/integrase [Croceibacterium sp.]